MQMAAAGRNLEAFQDESDVEAIYSVLELWSGLLESDQFEESIQVLKRGSGIPHLVLCLCHNER